ncbi:MAG: hypothetical protein K6F15_04090 [Treponema sp.]|nr:hypothetical protein [Treponema sp.]
MWDAISSVLNGSNSVFVMLFIMILVMWFSIMAKNGFFRVRIKGLKFGSEELERKIIRQQSDWVKLYLDGMEARLPHPEGYDTWRSKYILERIYDEILTWITYNHISTDDIYIGIKQNRVINLVNSLTIKKEYQTDEFRKVIKDEMAFVITKLVEIRKLYSKEV